MNQEAIDAEARKILQWSDEDFASGLITMLFLNVLEPKGIKELTVVVKDSVFTLGEGDPEKRLEKAKSVLEAELNHRGNKR
ncbi:hypothetical protein [Acidithiobacillus sp.]|uniref:hypothetical protein n=1 Tax=Acidithiobacillus sp. TaxID=1872118 RepID=UPI003D00FA54